jgi:hypothetical protein
LTSLLSKDLSRMNDFILEMVLLSPEEREECYLSYGRGRLPNAGR